MLENKTTLICGYMNFLKADGNTFTSDDEGTGCSQFAQKFIMSASGGFLDLCEHQSGFVSITKLRKHCQL